MTAQYKRLPYALLYAHRAHVPGAGLPLVRRASGLRFPKHQTRGADVRLLRATSDFSELLRAAYLQQQGSVRGVRVRMVPATLYILRVLNAICTVCGVLGGTEP